MADNRRALLISLLNSIGIELPPGTKRPIPKLEARLLEALDASQSINKILPTGSTIDPSSLETFSIGGSNDEETLTFRMLYATMLGSDTVGETRADDFTNPFQDLKQTILALGQAWERGNTAVVLQDKEQTSAFCVKIVNAYKTATENEMPLIVLRYRKANVADRSTVNWISSHLGEGRSRVAQIKSPIEEQELLQRILEKNTERLSTNYTAPIEHPAESTFQVSFVLPLRALSHRELFSARIPKNECAWCGKVSKQRCLDCTLMNYCSTECQQKDWVQNHKTMCEALKGAVWQTITFKNHSPPPGVTGTNFVHFTHGMQAVSREISYDPPPNIHGSKPFIVKAQRSLVHAGLFLYDRVRSVEAVCDRGEDEDEPFDKVNEVVKAGYMGAKIFLWARRVGTWELSVALNKIPDPDRELTW